MRWQKTARLAIAAFVIVFAAIVFVALRRPAAPKPVTTTPREDPGTVVETRGRGDKPGTWEQFAPDGTFKFKVDFEKQLTYADGRNVLINALITLPEKDGRTVRIGGHEMEVITPKDGGPEIATAKASRGVTLKTSDGLEITSETATYDGKTEIVTVPGDVRFKKERLTGSGVGATYDQKRNVVWLLDRAKVNVEPDEKGEGALEATSTAAGLARAEHYLRLTGNAHVVSGTRTLDTKELTVQLSPDDRLIQNMALRGDSRITGAPGSGGAESMSARDIDLTYAPDGRTLQTAKLIENAVAQLGGGAGKPARKVSGRTIDVSLGSDGSTVTGLNATERVEVEIPAEGDAPVRRITSSTLTAGGATGLESATFAGGVVYREVRAARRGAAAGERIGRSLSLIVATEPGFGAIKQADFHGNVHIVDGATTADGQRAIYHVAQDTFDLVPSAADPGPPATVNDGRLLVHARNISFGIASKNLKADTDVRSSVQPSKGDGRGAPGQTAASDAKLPSMLKDDEPVNVTSNRLEYDGAASKAAYTGNAVLFQGQTSVKGDTIIVDDRSGNLDARGNVVTVMFLQETDSKTKATRTTQTLATGDSMLYEDAKRLATYRSGPTAKAHMNGTQGDLTADVVELFLKKGANELERAEADGHVTVKEDFRTATGSHLTYTAADDTYVMTGSPVEIEEKTATACRVTTGSTLKFLRAVVSTTITNNGVTPVTTRPCVARQSD